MKLTHQSCCFERLVDAPPSTNFGLVERNFEKICIANGIDFATLSTLARLDRGNQSWCTGFGTTFCYLKRFFTLPNESCNFQRLVYASLLHRLEAFGRDSNSDFAVQFRHKDSLFLEVDLRAALACRGEFSRTRAIRIPACNSRALTSYCTFSCHTFYWNDDGLPACPVVKPKVCTTGVIAHSRAICRGTIRHRREKSKKVSRLS